MANQKASGAWQCRELFFFPAGTKRLCGRCVSDGTGAALPDIKKVKTKYKTIIKNIPGSLFLMV